MAPDPTPGPAGQDPAGDGLTWGIQDRRNRSTVALLLWLLRRRRSRLGPVNRLRRGVRDRLCFALSSDIRSTAVGEDLFLPHPYGIVVHSRVRIGDGCTLYQNVTLGEDGTRPGVPVLEDGVVVGAGAAVLGAVRLGAGSVVGANAVVLADVPAGATAVGIPARVVDGPGPRPG